MLFSYKICVFCSNLTKNEFCNICINYVNEIKETYYIEGIPCQSIYRYNKYSRLPIMELKYNQNPFIGDKIGQHMGAKVFSKFKNYDIITTVPMHWKKFLFKHYNHSAEIGKSLSKSLKIPYEELFKKITYTSQKHKNKTERIGNLNNTIICIDNINIINKKILIVDDMITTGTTISICGQLLRHKGAYVGAISFIGTKKY